MTKGLPAMPNFIKDLGTFDFNPEERLKFRSGDLWRPWAEQYPEIFDGDDCRLAAGGSHYFEWLAAIHLLKTQGVFSLVEKYQFKMHPRKQSVVKRLAIPGFEGLLKKRMDKPRTQCPDMLAFQPDFSDWFFCEVKGPIDRLRPPQLEFFRELSDVTGKPVRLLSFQFPGGQRPRTYSSWRPPVTRR